VFRPSASARSCRPARHHRGHRPAAVPVLRPLERLLASRAGGYDTEVAEGALAKTLRGSSLGQGPSAVGSHGLAGMYTNGMGESVAVPSPRTMTRGLP